MPREVHAVTRKIYATSTERALLEEDARVETIFTMESAEDGRSYLERMEDNLERIARALNE